MDNLPMYNPVLFEEYFPCPYCGEGNYAKIYFERKEPFYMTRECSHCKRAFTAKVSFMVNLELFKLENV